MTEIEKNMNESMEQLRKFLNTAGKDLENDKELRAYFALPFIEDPYTEPFLSKVFEKPWADQLTENLQVFLNKHKTLVSEIGVTLKNKLIYLIRYFIKIFLHFRVSALQSMIMQIRVIRPYRKRKKKR